MKTSKHYILKILHCCYHTWNKVKCVKAWKNTWMPQTFAGLWITVSLLNWDKSLMLGWISLQARQFPKSFFKHQKPERNCILSSMWCWALQEAFASIRNTFSLTKINVQGIAVSSELALMLEWYFCEKKNVFSKTFANKIIKKEKCLIPL